MCQMKKKNSTRDISEAVKTGLSVVGTGLEAADETISGIDDGVLEIIGEILST